MSEQVGQSVARPEATVMRVEPYYDDGQVTLYCGDNRELLDRVAVDVDAIVTDPPYGDTSLDWDRTPDRFWLELAAIVGIRSLWCFGSFRFWMEVRSQFTTAGWRYAQEVVWEKHNGSSFHADRFKRVHGAFCGCHFRRPSDTMYHRCAAMQQAEAGDSGEELVTGATYVYVPQDVPVTDSMVERARLAGARWFAEHPDGASEDDEWRDHYRAVLEAAVEGCVD